VSRFADESLQRLEASVLLVSRTFVRLELPAPWASTTIPLPDAELAKGDTVMVAGREDAELDQLRAPRPGEPVEKQPGFRVLVVALPGEGGSRHVEVAWPSEAPAEPPPDAPADVAPDENDWSDV
jgi:hypothetical protein